MLASILRTYMSRNNGIYLSLDSLCELAKGFIYCYFFFGSEYSVFVFTGIGHPLNSSHFGHFSDATSHASHAFSRNACRGFHETSHTFHAFSRAVSHSLVCSVMLSTPRISGISRMLLPMLPMLPMLSVLPMLHPMLLSVLRPMLSVLLPVLLSVLYHILWYVRSCFHLILS